MRGTQASGSALAVTNAIERPSGDHATSNSFSAVLVRFVALFGRIAAKISFCETYASQSVIVKHGPATPGGHSVGLGGSGGRGKLRKNAIGPSGDHAGALPSATNRSFRPVTSTV